MSAVDQTMILGTQTSARFTLGAIAAAMLAVGVGLRASARVPQGSTGAISEPDPAERRLETEGQAALKRLCGGCHGLEISTSPRRSPASWDEAVDSMVQLGARMTDADYKLLVDYLSRFYGRVTVNQASAADLVAVLGITDREAQAIVQYRTTQGPFADLAALIRVPGIDKSRIEAATEALRFTP